MTSIVPEKGDLYVVPLRFLILFLGGLFSLFLSNMIGWSGAGKLFYELFIGSTSLWKAVCYGRRQPLTLDNLSLILNFTLSSCLYVCFTIYDTR